jgi:hypothetical protein
LTFQTFLQAEQIVFHQRKLADLGRQLILADVMSAVEQEHLSAGLLTDHSGDFRFDALFEEDVLVPPSRIVSVNAARSLGVGSALGTKPL